MIKYFRIGDFTFSLEYSKEIIFPDNFLLFEIEKCDVLHTFEIIVDNVLPQYSGKIIAQREDLLVLENELGEIRYMGVKGTNRVYACSIEKENNTIITMNRNELADLNIDPLFTSLFSLEKHLLKRKQMILHCAYLEHEKEAILFTAPSETGKTTQATLWEKYKGSKSVNGDRALLKCENGIWVAQGWPVCGTSEICHNKTLPIRSIVVLAQGKENVVKELNAMEAFKNLYSQITLNRWNKRGHLEAMNLIDQLIKDVKIYHLACTISKEAVDCLYKKIYE